MYCQLLAWLGPIINLNCYRPPVQCLSSALPSVGWCPPDEIQPTTHKRRVERARAQSAAEGLLLPAEHGSRPVSAQGLRRRGRAIAQADRESAQGGGAAGEEGESSVGAAREAADDRTARGGRGGQVGLYQDFSKFDSK